MAEKEKTQSQSVAVLRTYDQPTPKKETSRAPFGAFVGSEWFLRFLVSWFPATQRNEETANEHEAGLPSADEYSVSLMDTSSELLRTSLVNLYSVHSIGVLPLPLRTPQGLPNDAPLSLSPDELCFLYGRSREANRSASPSSIARPFLIPSAHHDRPPPGVVDGSLTICRADWAPGSKLLRSAPLSGLVILCRSGSWPSGRMAVGMAMGMAPTTRGNASAKASAGLLPEGENYVQQSRHNEVMLGSSPDYRGHYTPRRGVLWTAWTPTGIARAVSRVTDPVHVPRGRLATLSDTTVARPLQIRPPQYES
ncbi:uncharacterized protein N7482_003168 [Penicillium canariense]|uniref:Uncharacterized protein n=1 Tax=Penicillium canariense TaxID=189055 RepID=A0A9W9LUQ3_9EURO|nr:uncharacterized protein N7482_003168 [Penicillium canariense]KAJ5177291.1 hypothetical protein N7482_003168 [Penicillium canariense]